MKRELRDTIYGRIRRSFAEANLLTTKAICFGILGWLSASSAAQTTIVAFGDSTTAPRGKLRTYADLLEEELAGNGVPVRVINAGIGGHNTGHARARFERDVMAHDPDVVIIQFGINDAAVDVWKAPPSTESRVSLVDYEKNLRHFIHVLNERKVTIVLMTPNPLRWTPKMREMYGRAPYVPGEEDGFNLLLRKYAEKVRQIAKSEKVPLIDVYRVFQTYGEKEGNSVGDLLLDGIHPNDAGHRLVGDQLISLMKKTATRSAPELKITTSSSEK